MRKITVNAKLEIQNIILELARNVRRNSKKTTSRSVIKINISDVRVARIIFGLTWPIEEMLNDALT